MALLAGMMVVATTGTAQAAGDSVVVCKYTGASLPDASHVIEPNGSATDEDGWFSDGGGKGGGLKSFVLDWESRWTNTDRDPTEAELLAMCPQYDPDGESSTVELTVSFVADCVAANQWSVSNSSGSAVEFSDGTTTRTAPANGSVAWSNTAGSVTITWGGAGTAYTSGSDSASAGTDLTCGGGPTSTVVTPTGVTFDDPSCTDLGGSTIVGAVDTASVDYVVTGTPGLGQTVSVVALPKGTATFPTDAVTQWGPYEFPTLAELACGAVGGVDGEDFCPNLDGVQEGLPVGHSLLNGLCILNQVRGVEGEAPSGNAPGGKTPGKKPTEEPTVKGVAAEAPASGKARTSVQVPLAVDAGFGVPSAGGTATANLLGQGLMGAGLMLLLLAGWTRKDRLSRGAHQV